MLRDGGLLRRRDPAPGGRPEPDGGGHPRRRTVTRRHAGPSLHARTVAARVRARRAGVRRQPDRAVRPPRADARRLGHRPARPRRRGGSRAGRHPVRRRGRPPRLGARRPWRAPVQRRRSAGTLVVPALHHGDLARRRRRDPALGHRGRAGRRRPCPAPPSSSTPSSGSTAPRPTAPHRRGRRGRPDHPHDLGGLRRHGRRRRRRHGATREPPCARWCCRGPSTSASAARCPCRPCCAGSGPASPTAPSSPCPSPTAPSSAPAPSSSWPATGPRCPCHPLAGTVPRGDTARTDADAQRDLAGSAKNRGRAPLRRRRHRRRPGALLRGAVGPGRALRGGLPLRGPPRARGSRAGWPGPSGCSTCCTGSIPRPPWAGRRAPRPWPSSPATRRANGATGPARSGGSVPGATASG